MAARQARNRHYNPEKNTLHFVEVKTVTSRANGFAEEKINKKKIKHMLLAARHYLRLSNWGGTVQLDALAIHINADVPEYHLFEDIWP